jgi:glycosyltransferase involved in cell wall biosynthesis
MVKDQILETIAGCGTEVYRIYVVDDSCPQRSGDHVAHNVTDDRVVVIYHTSNLGVGGAVMSGYQAAIDDAMDIIVKIDGDGQMDPSLIPNFVTPIIEGWSDYTKGNRFFDLEAVKSMPGLRIFGNAILSFMTKLSSGYWNLFDPTNGYTAIHADVAKRLPFNKISKRYFFETDMLFRLNTIRAVVVDIPMEAIYANETSNLKISKILTEFMLKHVRNFFKRLFYNYYLRDLSLASLELPIGLLLFTFGTVFGAYHWYLSSSAGITASAGTVMLSSLPILTGTQLILAFIGSDISSVPTQSIHRNLKNSHLLRS